MIGDELREQLKGLARRLDRVEAALGLSPPERTQAEPPKPVEPTPRPVPPQEPESPAGAAEHALPELEARPPIRQPVSPPAAALPDTPSDPSGLSALQPAPAAPAAERRSLELRIGLHWTAWAGAVVVVMAVGFFVKLAHDQGWFGLISPAWRCLLAAAFGGLLIVAGEITLRKLGRPAAVGMFGAGLGTLYLTAMASYHYYNVVPEAWAFWLSAAVAGLGILITIHTRLLTIGVLSLVGGYLAPVLLPSEPPFAVALPLYAVTLLAIGLALSAARPRPFRPLRWVALVAHGLLASAWIVQNASEHWLLALGLMGTSCYLAVAEAYLAARRNQSSIGNCVAALAATAWFVTLGCWVLDTTQPADKDWLGLFATAVACVAAGVALLPGPGLASLRRAPRDALDKLTVTMWAQVGVLMALAVALQFDGYGQTVGWLALALASIELGRRLPSRGVTVFGLIVGCLAVIRVATLDRMSDDLAGEVSTIAGLIVTHWTLLAAIAIAGAHLAARRVLWSEQGTLPAQLCFLATAGWLAVCKLQASGITVTALWLLGSVALLAFERCGRRQAYLQAGLLVLCAAAGHWLVADALLPRIDSGWESGARQLLLNWQMAMALAIAATGWWACRILARRGREGGEGEDAGSTGWVWHQDMMVIGIIALLATALSLEADRSVAQLAAAQRLFGHSAGHLRQLMLTLVWTFGALAAGAVGTRATASLTRPQGSRQLPRFAWLLLAGCGAKWVFYDTLLLRLLAGRHVVTDLWPAINLQMVVGAVLSVAAITLAWLTRPAPGGAGVAEAASWRRAGHWILVGAALLLMWGLSFEAERAVGMYELRQPEDAASVWHALQLRALWLTALWATGGLAMLLCGRRRNSEPMLATGWRVLVGAALAWLTFDTLSFRVLEGVAVAVPVVNLQFGVGVFVALLLGVAVMRARRHWPNTVAAPPPIARAARTAMAAMALFGLWLGSLEIDRFLCPEAARVASPEMARQTALSVYWGLYGIGLVVAGFARRSVWLRCGGLALLAVTLTKVLTIDLANVQYLYRVLSLLATGLLLIVTSAAYAKLTARLLVTSDLQPVRTVDHEQSG